MRWIALPVVLMGVFVLSLPFFQKKSPAPVEAPPPTASEVVANVVHAATPKLQAAERKVVRPRTIEVSKEPAAEEMVAPIAKPRLRRLTAEESFSWVKQPAEPTSTHRVVRYNDPNANKWLKPTDLSLQNREKKEIELECDEWKCPLQEKKTIPVFGVVIRPEGASERFGQQLKPGSFIEKTPALYVE